MTHSGVVYCGGKCAEQAKAAKASGPTRADAEDLKEGPDEQMASALSPGLCYLLLQARITEFQSHLGPVDVGLQGNVVVSHKVMESVSCVTCRLSALQLSCF